MASAELLGGYQILRPQLSKYWGDVSLASPVALTPMLSAVGTKAFLQTVKKRSV
jgi:hypothetical protein